jgi:hypothetical protein
LAFTLSLILFLSVLNASIPIIWCQWNPSYSDFRFVNGRGEIGSKFELELMIAEIPEKKVNKIMKLDVKSDYEISAQNF